MTWSLRSKLHFGGQFPGACQAWGLRCRGAWALRLNLKLFWRETLGNLLAKRQCCSAGRSRQDQAGSNEITLAIAPGIIDCRRDDPTILIRYCCPCKQKFVKKQCPTICFVNQQNAWFEAYLHDFSWLQLEFDRVDINFFPTKIASSFQARRSRNERNEG